MKHKLFNKLWLRVGMIVAIMTTALAGTAWAETTAGFTLASTTTVPLAANANPATTTITGSASETWNVQITGTWTSSSMQGSTNNKYWQMGANGKAITSATFSTSGILGTISKVEVNCSSYQGKAKVNCTVGGNDFGTQNQSTSSWANNTGGNLTFTGSASGEIIVTFDNSAQQARAVYIQSITVTYTSSTPSISAFDVNIAYDATNGEIAYTIINPTSATLSAASNSDWITNVAVDATNSKVTFNTSTNPNTTQRTGTITLSYTGATNKVITITQAPAPILYTTIPALLDAATSTSTLVNVTFGNWVVSGVNGNQVFVTDGTNGFIVYQSDHGFVVGNTLSGTVSCNLVLFHGSAELTGVTSTTEGLTVGTGSVTLVSTTIDALGAVNTGSVVTLNNLTYDGSVLSDGTNHINYYTSLYNETSLESGKKYNITGVFVLYDNIKRILPRSAADIEEYVAPTHTVSFSVNGIVTSTDDVSEGAAITFPADPADINGKTFVGWLETTITGTTDTAPTFVTSATMGTADVTYYAVFATLESTGSTTTVTDELTKTTTGVTGTSYTDWSKTGTSGAVYTGNSAGSNESIQLRAQTPSGIVTTNSGGKVKKVTVTWESHTTDGRTLNVYGSNSVYTGASDLYGDDVGTLIGTIVNGTSTELTITGDYEYVGLRSASGAMYLTSISIDWETGTPDTYSGYCTAIVEPYTIPSSGLGTYCSQYPLDLDELPVGVKAYAVTAKNDKSATLKEVTGTVKAGVGLIYGGTPGTEITFTFTESTTEPENLLVGTLVPTYLEAGTAYGLKSGVFQPNLAGTIPAHRAYLPASAGAVKALSLVFDDDPTGIENLNVNDNLNDAIYNLAGQRLNKVQKGINIVNGKKILK